MKSESPLRSGLLLIWTLNFKAMPTALIWSASLVVSIQTRLMAVRLVAIFVSSLCSILGSYLIRHNLNPRLKFSLSSALKDKFSVATLAISGLVFAITLENVSRYSQSSFIIRLLMVSNFITVLVAWLFIQVVVIPIRLTIGSQLSRREMFRLSFNYVSENKKILAISMFSLLLGWPLFFFYFLLALTFAQSMTFCAIENGGGTPIGK